MDRFTIGRRISSGSHAVVRAVRKWRPEALASRQREGAVAVAHVGRSGSTVLGDLLAQHPRIQWDGETYGKLFHRMLQAGCEDQRTTVDLVGYLEREMRAVGPGWFGFDYLLAHLQRTRLSVDDHAERLRMAGFRHFVLLRRANLLRVEASGRLAHTSGVWHARDSSPIHRRTSVTLDLSYDADHGTSLLRRLRALEGFHAELRRAHRNDATIELVYEHDIEADPRVGFRKIVDFLGLEPHEVEVRLRRLNLRPMSEMIENFDEVRSSLEGSEFEWMLETTASSAEDL